MENGVNSKGSALLDAQREIRELEKNLAEARCRLNSLQPGDGGAAPSPPPSRSEKDTADHFLLLLSDSALPLGSFAFSSGMESYLAHASGGLAPRPAGPFATFLPQSISAFASTNLPFALAVHDDPSALLELDDVLDATTTCTVGRRASTAQGRALFSVWEKSFAGSVGPEAEAACAALGNFAEGMRRGEAPGHLSTVFGAVCAAVGIDRGRMAYVLVMGHVKALVSAAVRAGVMGPYRAQGVLGGEDVRSMVRAAVAREWDVKVEDAGQSVPIMDMWVGRHEVLYSRIFNS